MTRDQALLKAMAGKGRWHQRIQTDKGQTSGVVFSQHFALVGGATRSARLISTVSIMGA